MCVGKRSLLVGEIIAGVEVLGLGGRCCKLLLHIASDSTLMGFEYGDGLLKSVLRGEEALLVGEILAEGGGAGVGRKEFQTPSPYYRTTRPEEEPPIRASTSWRVLKLKSPLIECFKQDAATAYLTAVCGSLSSGVIRAKIRPPAKESPPPTRSTMFLI